MAGNGHSRSTGSTRRAVAASVIGTVLEWYDFYIYGTAATLVFGKLFFPGFSPVAGTLAAFAAYGIGFFLKPVGGVILSRFGDIIGRKRVMVISLVLMGASTGLIGLLPTFATIGMLAPLLLVLLRLLQSIGAGAEYGSAVTMVAEHASAKRRGLVASLPGLGVSLGILVGTGMFALLSLMSQEQFEAWGWRIPFLVGFSLVGVGLYMRLRVTESPTFERARARDQVSKAPLTHVWKTQRRSLFIAAGARSADSVGGQMFNVFALSYTTTQLGLHPSIGLSGVMAANLVGLAVIPLVGMLCDKVGRRPVYLGGMIFLAVFTFPFFWLLNTREPALVIAALVLAYGFGVKILLSASGAYLAELFDTQSRNTGITLARTSSDPIGGLTPLIATALLAWSGSYVSVALFLLLFILIGLGSVYLGPETRHVAFENDPASLPAREEQH